MQPSIHNICCSADINVGQKYLFPFHLSDLTWEKKKFNNLQVLSFQRRFPDALKRNAYRQSFKTWKMFLKTLSIYWLFFISSRSLLNLSCIFSILVSRLFICDSILISRFWINFTIISRNSLSGRFPISSSFVWFGELNSLFLKWHCVISTLENT